MPKPLPLPFWLLRAGGLYLLLLSSPHLAQGVVSIFQRVLQYVRRCDQLLAMGVWDLWQEGDKVVSFRLHFFTGFMLLSFRFWVATMIAWIILPILAILENLVDALPPAFTSSYQETLSIWANRHAQGRFYGAGAFFTAFAMVREPRPLISFGLPPWLLACWTAYGSVLWMIWARDYANRHPTSPTAGNAPAAAVTRPTSAWLLIPTCKRIGLQIVSLYRRGSSIVRSKAASALQVLLSPLDWRHVFLQLPSISWNHLARWLGGSPCWVQVWDLRALNTRVRILYTRSNEAKLWLCGTGTFLLLFATIDISRMSLSLGSLSIPPWLIASSVHAKYTQAVSLFKSQSSGVFKSVANTLFIPQFPNFSYHRKLDEPNPNFHALPPTILPPCTCEMPPPVVSNPPVELRPLLASILAECKCMDIPSPASSEVYIPYDFLRVESHQSGRRPVFDFDTWSTSSASSEEEDSSPEQHTRYDSLLARRSLVFFPSPQRVLSPILEVSSVASSSSVASIVSSAPPSVAPSSPPPSPGGYESGMSSSSYGTMSPPPSPSPSPMKPGPRRVELAKAREAQAHFLSFSAGLKLSTPGRATQQEDFQTNAATPSKPLHSFGKQDGPAAPTQLLGPLAFHSPERRSQRQCHPNCNDLFCDGDCRS
ncbi:hypothetical protein B0H15DRAFT_796373 [Mycena belliarum]|uniref:Uncharacterized protein n=1 Tax=Mycena belliarum TaxID=1033014 RepID=A0AAD6UFD1_9AGAR|nr:hypothetical protein B0H15DRAFT_796373 [Mycena belliae]